MNKKIKVAFIAACPFKFPRGTPIRIFRTAEAISSLGHEVHVIAYHLGDKAEDSDLKVHRIWNIPFYKKVEPGPSWIKLFLVDFFLFLKIFQVVKKERFDLVHAHHYEGLLTSCLISKVFKIPIIYDAHTLLETELHHYKMLIGRNGLRLIGKLIDSYLPKCADRVITVSDEIRERLIQYADIPPEKIYAIPNGVDVHHFIVDKNKETRYRDVKTILGYAGNFAEFQRMDLLLEAVKLLTTKQIPFILNLYSSSSSENLELKMKSLGLETNVNFVPTTYESLPECLAETDILLNTRVDGEGYPQKLLNYMAAGKPIVSFAGSARNLTHLENGWVVKGEDIHGFVDAIIALINDRSLREKLGASARKYMQESYMWSNRAETIHTVYEDILNH